MNKQIKNDIPWFKVKNSSSFGEIWIYGIIDEDLFFGDEITPTVISEKLKELEGCSSLNIYVNSPGGSVFAGIAITSALNRFEAKKTIFVDGVAASIASFIVVEAADEVVMPFNSQMMIHSPTASIFNGKSSDFRRMADRLDVIRDENLIHAYEEKTKNKGVLSRDQILKMIEDETFMTASEAFEYGFCDRIEEKKKISACLRGKKAIFNSIEYPLEVFKGLKIDDIKEEPINNDLSSLNKRKLMVSQL